MRKMEISNKLALICLFLLTFCGFAHANRIIYVDNDGPADFNNIQAAIDDANDGDTVLVADGIYTGDGNRDIHFSNKAIIVKSENGAETCIIDCQGSEGNLHRGFEFLPVRKGQAKDAVIDGFTITNGYAYDGGALNCEYANLTIKNCIIRNNTAAIEYGDPFSFITAGGGIYCYSGNLKISNCYFYENTATAKGGAIRSSSSILSIINCEFNNNRASLGGGAISSEHQDNILLKNCLISGNYTTDTDNGSGGGIACDRNNSEIVNCSFISNKGSKKGGGIYLSNSNANVINSIIYDNSALDGSEIALQYGGFNPSSLTISHSNVKGGNAAIYVDNQSVLDWQESNIDADSLFANPGYWADANDPNIIAEPNDLNAIWIDGDYHLKSQAGRYEPDSQSWVHDDVTSPCIDAGDPNSPIGIEPFPNGGYINMGAYGGTVEASKSYFGKPVCETIIAGDINGDCKVDELDMAIMMIHWLEDYNPVSEKVIDGMEFRIKTDKTFYKAGENVQIDFTVTNNTNETVHISCYQAPEFNLLVQKDGTNIWKLIYFFQQYSPGVELTAGETKGISHSWDMKNNDGYFVGPGTYTIVGEMFTSYFDPENPGRTEVKIAITIAANTEP